MKNATAAATRTAATIFTKQDLTMWGMTLKVMRDEGGVRALYRGLIPTAMGVAPYVGKFSCFRVSPLSGTECQC